VTVNHKSHERSFAPNKQVRNLERLRVMKKRRDALRKAGKGSAEQPARYMRELKPNYFDVMRLVLQYNAGFIS
jgi:hypothetical protein